MICLDYSFVIGVETIHGKEKKEYDEEVLI